MKTRQHPILMLPAAKAGTTADAASPFRYPGGKRFLSGFLRNYIRERVHTPAKILVEPFCGGAGASITLLLEGTVDQIKLNDVDIQIYSAWKAMVDETDRFLHEVQSVPLTLSEWQNRLDFVKSTSNSSYSFDLGFSAFFLNRTSRSGIISRSGPIGGLSQEGKWKLDARFNRDRLSEKINIIGQHRARISITNLDALNFLHRTLTESSRELEKITLLIDPPYYNEGRRLYYDGMSEAKHVALSDILTGTPFRNWILTYDNCNFIKNLYENLTILVMDVRYCLQNRTKSQELMIVPDIKIPNVA